MSAIEQHYRDPGLVQSLGDGPVDRVLLRGQFERREKHSRYLLRNELSTGLRGLQLNVGLIAEGTAPQEDMVTPMLSLGHAATQWFEDFRTAQFGDQKAEGITAGSGVRTNVTARSGPTFDDSR